MQKLVHMHKKKSVTLSSKPTYQGYSHGFKIAIIDPLKMVSCLLIKQPKNMTFATPVSVSGSRNMQGKSPKQKIEEMERNLKKQKKRF